MDEDIREVTNAADECLNEAILGAERAAVLLEIKADRAASDIWRRRALALRRARTTERDEGGSRRLRTSSAFIPQPSSLS